MEKKIITVWNEKVDFLDLVRNEVINSYNNKTSLSEEISDLVSYEIIENESSIKLIIKLI